MLHSLFAEVPVKGFLLFDSIGDEQIPLHNCKGATVPIHEYCLRSRGGSKISGNGVHMYKGLLHIVFCLFAPEITPGEKMKYKHENTKHQFSLPQQDYCKTILKAIKNATGTSVIFPINTGLIHFVVVLTSVPNVGERFTKT